VTSPSKAAGLLGLDVLKSLVLVVDVFSSFDTSRVPGFSIEKLWNHSLLVAQYARSIAQQEKVNKTTVENAYLAGVFHDIGQFLLVVHMPDVYCRVVQYAEDKHVSLVDAEKAILNATHGEVGAYLLGLWGFGDSIVEASAYHHDPGRCLRDSFGPLTAVHVADAIERTNNSSFCFAVDEGYIERLGLKDRLVDWREATRRIRADRVSENRDGKNIVY
jgi:HD-like signal output (HDOD) protein